ncbi:MAG: hypothetical protein JEY99_11210 [Spirochaetales bacterium]|nr:hypothetical protein [Spirochaetales bacterium]
MWLGKLGRSIVRGWPAKIMSFAAAIFLFLFHSVTSLEERYFTVPLQIEVSEGYVVSGAYPHSVRVTLRGNEETIYRILEEDVSVYADFSSHQSEGLFRSPVEFEGLGTAAEAGSLEISVEPNELTLEIEKNIRKNVEVFPSMTGLPAKGYDMTQFFVNPNTVQVEGPRSHLKELSTVLTETIDLTGRTNDFTQRVALSNEDPYLVFPGESSVEFLGIIRATILVKDFEDVGMVWLDLDEDLVIDILPEGGSIKLQGAQTSLESLNPADLFISVDCSSIKGPGIHIVDVRPEVPPGVNVLDWSPEKITLNIIERQAEEE